MFLCGLENSPSSGPLTNHSEPVFNQECESGRLATSSSKELRPKYSHCPHFPQFLKFLSACMLVALTFVLPKVRSVNLVIILPSKPVFCFLHSKRHQRRQSR